jgi:GxxExxY protein
MEVPVAMGFELSRTGVPFEGQKPIPVVYGGQKLDCGYRADIIVFKRASLEIKAIPTLASIHDAVMLTYLRLSGCHIWLIINFHPAVLEDGIHRYVWNYNSRITESEHRSAEVAEECRKRRSEC